METLLSELGYSTSSHHKQIDEWNEPETAHLSRLASKAGVQSVYLLSPNYQQDKVDPLPSRPIVYIAEAKTSEKAHQIHRKIWNLNSAPFLVIKLPDEVRVYTNFSYSSEDEEIGVLTDEVKLWQVAELLRDISAESIDSGHIWQSEFGKKTGHGSFRG